MNTIYCVIPQFGEYWLLRCIVAIVIGILLSSDTITWVDQKVFLWTYMFVCSPTSIFWATYILFWNFKTVPPKTFQGYQILRGYPKKPSTLGGLWNNDSMYVEKMRNVHEMYNNYTFGYPMKESTHLKCLEGYLYIGNYIQQYVVLLMKIILTLS